jgi:hypothetical protein
MMFDELKPIDQEWLILALSRPGSG